MPKGAVGWTLGREYCRNRAYGCLEMDPWTGSKGNVREVGLESGRRRGLAGLEEEGFLAAFLFRVALDENRFHVTRIQAGVVHHG